MIVGTDATARDQHICTSFYASALFSEYQRSSPFSYNIYYVASLILHANIAEVTIQEMSLYCLILWVVFIPLTDNRNSKIYKRKTVLLKIWLH